MKDIKAQTSKLGYGVLMTFHMVVLAAAVLLIFIITRDIFYNVSFIVDPQYLKFQFWICVIFICDVIVDFIVNSHTWKRFFIDFLFFLLCIPIVNVIDYFHLSVSGELLFLLRLLPMIRATYVIVKITGTVNSDVVTNLFRAYITLFIVIVYFSSLMFFVEESPVNQDVGTYWSALWWTVMTLTTAGCYITEVTTVGKILSVILSGGGLILFPIFTVYVANAVSGTSASSTDSCSSSSANSSSDHTVENKTSDMTEEDGNNSKSTNDNVVSTNSINN